jgi:hypothetical protein
MLGTPFCRRFVVSGDNHLKLVCLRIYLGTRDFMQSKVSTQQMCEFAILVWPLGVDLSFSE